MSTIGRNPALASPAAKATACDSQMPTSKNRSGNSSRTGSSMLPWHMAAVDHGHLRVAQHLLADRVAGELGVGWPESS